MSDIVAKPKRGDRRRVLGAEHDERLTAQIDVVEPDGGRGARDGETGDGNIGRVGAADPRREVGEPTVLNGAGRETRARRELDGEIVDAPVGGADRRRAGVTPA